MVWFIQEFHCFKTSKSQSCVYRDRPDHRSVECEFVKAPNQRKAMLSKKKLCFNSTGSARRVADCRSTRTCKNFGKRHLTSICGDTSAMIQPVWVAAHGVEDLEVIYPNVLEEINGTLKVHALLDTGAGSSVMHQQNVLKPLIRSQNMRKHGEWTWCWAQHEQKWR